MVIKISLHEPVTSAHKALCAQYDRSFSSFSKFVQNSCKQFVINAQTFETCTKFFMVVNILYVEYLWNYPALSCLIMQAIQ